MVEAGVQPENVPNNDFPSDSPILVSACLVGMCTSYKGASWLREDLVALVRQGLAIPVCPEQLGGLPTPRDPAEIVGGTGEDVLAGRARVMTRDGRDVTAEFVRGSQEVLRLAKLVRPRAIVLKERSPSCGVDGVYDGTFSGVVVPGMGVTAALLKREGFMVQGR